MKRNIILTSVALGAALAFSAALHGQNLNPTVEVDRTYEGKPVGILKEDVPMQVPDSLTSLKLDFDYSVFDNPYKGSYEFRPYLVIMKPEAGNSDARGLYVRLGAGYSLHPEAEVVFSPRMTGPFHISAYFNHGSYFGNYRNVWPSGSGDSYSLKAGNVSPSGNLNSIIGNSNASMPDSHKGVSTKDTLVSRNLNAFDLGARLKSNAPGLERFYYDAGFSLRAFSDGLKGGFGNDILPAGKSTLGGSEFSLDASLGTVLAGVHNVVVRLDAQAASYSKLFDSSVGLLAVTPNMSFPGTGGGLSSESGWRPSREETTVPSRP